MKAALIVPRLFADAAVNLRALGVDHCLGGACVVSAQGEVLAHQPLGVEGILMVDMGE